MKTLHVDPQSAKHNERFESDREALPFPRGGVFGDPTPPDAQPDPTDTAALAEHVLRTVDDLQSRVGDLEREIDVEFGRELQDIADVIGRIHAGHDDDWPPTAA